VICTVALKPFHYFTLASGGCRGRDAVTLVSTALHHRPDKHNPISIHPPILAVILQGVASIRIAAGAVCTLEFHNQLPAKGIPRTQKVNSKPANGIAIKPIAPSRSVEPCSRADVLKNQDPIPTAPSTSPYPRPLPHASRTHRSLLLA
jgi:hypothetical protein